MFNDTARVFLHQLNLELQFHLKDTSYFLNAI